MGNCNEKIKVALIGAGYTANEHLKAFRDIEEVEITGIFSRTREKAESLATKYNILNVCDTLQELWDKTRANIVVIAVNEMSMPQTIIKCLDYDWEILCEKPPALCVENAKEIRDIANKKNKKIRVALNRSSYSVTGFVKKELEKIDGKRIIFAQDQEDPERALSMGKPKEVVERWMYANSIHILDYFRIFARGNFKMIKTSGSLDFNKPCFIESHIEFDSGDLGIYHAFWNEPGPWAITVHLPDIRFELRPLEEGRIQKRFEKSVEMEVNIWDKNFKPGFRKQAEEMVKLIKFEACEVPILDEAIYTMELIKEIYKV